MHQHEAALKDRGRIRTDGKRLNCWSRTNLKLQQIAETRPPVSQGREQVRYMNRTSIPGKNCLTSHVALY